MSGVSRRARKQNATGETQLHVAARLNNVRDVVILLLDGAHVDATDYAGLNTTSEPTTAVRNYSAPDTEQRSIVMSVSVCVCVCLSASTSW